MAIFRFQSKGSRISRTLARDETEKSRAHLRLRPEDLRRHLPEDFRFGEEVHGDRHRAVLRRAGRRDKALRRLLLDQNDGLRARNAVMLHHVISRLPIVGVRPGIDEQSGKFGIVRNTGGALKRCFFVARGLLWVGPEDVGIGVVGQQQPRDLDHPGSSLGAGPQKT